MISPKTRRHQKMRRLYEAAVRSRQVGRFHADLHEEFNDPSTNLQDYSVRQLFEQFVDNGVQLVNEVLRPSSAGGVQILESAAYVDTQAFANVMGQWAYSATLKGYNSPELIGDQLVETIHTDFNGERIPGVGRLGDDVEVVGEGNPYPNATVGEEWIDTPATIKRGLIVNITKEAIFFDRTGLLLQEAMKVGNTIAINREKRILDVVCGITSVYRRNGGAAEATYSSDNTKASNALSDWTSLDAIEQLFNAMTDPTNGEPIMITPDTLLVPKALERTAMRIINATQVRRGTDSGNTQTYTPGSQVTGGLRVVSGSYVKQRTSSDSTYFYGKPTEAFVYMENWPITTIQAPENSELSFTSDVVTRIKVSERGAAGVRDRKKMAKATA